MLDEFGTPNTIWGEVAHTAVNILNKAHVRVNSDKNPYEIWYGNTPTVKHFKFFGRKCYIKYNEVSLNLEEMKEYFLITLLEVKHTNTTIRDFKILLNVLML